jgi:hypothetical protein
LIFGIIIIAMMFLRPSGLVPERLFFFRPPSEQRKSKTTLLLEKEALEGTQSR